MDVDINYLSGFSSNEREIFMNSVVPALKLTINSPDFEKRVLGYTRKEGRKCFRSFKSDKGYGRPRIFRMFMSGSDRFNVASDQDMDIFLTAYTSRSSTIGYTYPNTFKTWINRRFFSSWLQTEAGRCKIVGNLVHEYMHNLGFNHAVRWNRTRKHTVPYAYGDIAAELAAKYI